MIKHYILKVEANDVRYNLDLLSEPSLDYWAKNLKVEKQHLYSALLNTGKTNVHYLKTYILKYFYGFR